MSRPTSTQIRNIIIPVMEVASTPQSHEDVARKLRWLTNPHRIAMNMDRLARDGILRITWEGHTKRYKLATEREPATAETREMAEAI